MKQLADGVYLYSREKATREQFDWNEFDECKTFDFTAFKFWVITDSGQQPMGFDSEIDAEQAIILT